MPMFLSAVLQAHTDSVPQPKPQIANDDTVELPRLDAALAVPLKDRVQPLPSAHRSRWV
jgi:hypothetical protein